MSVCKTILHYRALSVKIFSSARARNPDRRTLAAFVDTSRVRFANRGELGHFYLLVSGSVCVEISRPGYRVCVASLSSGDAFGCGSLLGDHEARFQARSHNKRTVAIRLDAEKLLAACQRDPILGSTIFRQVCALVAERLRATEKLLAEFAGARSADAR